jgi:hypothetical protein
MVRTRSRRISAAEIVPHRFHWKRSVSPATLIPRS